MRAHKSLDKLVRRITSGILVTLLVFLGVAVISSPLPSGSFTVSADTYEEPVIRIGLVLREKRATSYKVSAAKGFRFGYMDQSNDRFVSFDITDETAVKAELDDFYYIEFYSFFSEGKQYDLSSETATDLLLSLVEGYALRLIPAFCDAYCYRVGPFSSSEEAEEFFLMIQSDIENKNQNGSSLQIGIRTVSPTSSSVLLRKILLVDGKEQPGEPIFSFAGSNADCALAVAPAQYGDSEISMSANSYTYPGIMEFRRCHTAPYDSLAVINVLPLETYVACVNSWEIFDTWPLEAHKAFTVLVRTYALRTGMSNKHLSSGADLCGDICCQAYRGNSRVTDVMMEAANCTKGIVLGYDGALAKVYYAAVSGGTTVNSEESWNETVPYMKAVPGPWERYRDYGTHTSRAVWHKEFTGAELYVLLQKSGKHPNIQGEITDVHIDRFCTNSNYVYSITFTDQYGNTSTATKSDTIRYLLGFDSGNFVVGQNGETVDYPEYSLDCFPSVYDPDAAGYGEYASFEDALLKALDAEGNAVDFSLEYVQVAWKDEFQKLNLKDYNLKILASSSELMVNEEGLPDILNGEIVFHMRQITLSGEEGKFIFEGRGWGHGIGYSQYGIWDLARLGYGYETILRYYQKGIDLVSLNDLGF